MQYMKNLMLFIGMFLLCGSISAQCYIQYTYDASGNRTKREYVGCSRPATTDPMAETMLDTSYSSGVNTRTELVRHDLEHAIKVYPNPSDDVVKIVLEAIDPTWTYQLLSMSGAVLKQSSISSQQVEIEVSQLPAAAYILNISDGHGQIIYHTKIIKQ